MSNRIRSRVPVHRWSAGLVVAGCAVALFHRARTGEAQKVSTSLAAMSVLLQTEALARFDGAPPAPVGSRDHLGSSDADRFYRRQAKALGQRRKQEGFAMFVVPMFFGFADRANKTNAVLHTGARLPLRQAWRGEPVQPEPAQH